MSFVRAALLSVVFTAAAPALADPLPPHLASSLSTLSLKSTTLEGGDLRVTFARPTVTLNLVAGATSAACSPLYLHGKQGWGGAKINTITILNQVGGQG